jgi:D-glycero-D-manno-heptose 1,7-bisphosphate phosphatase
MEPLIFNIKNPVYENTIYLDKDGVLNTALRRANKLSSPRRMKEVRIKKDLTDIFNFSNKKFNLVIISNQPDLTRGLVGENFLRKNVDEISNYLPIDQALFCPHTENMGCHCRKPKTGLIKEFRRLFPHNHKKELFIGDQVTDERCAFKLGIPFIKVDKPLSLHNNIILSLESY